MYKQCLSANERISCLEFVHCLIFVANVDTTHTIPVGKGVDTD